MSDSSWPRGVRLPFPSLPGRERPLSPRLLAAAEPILQVAGIGAWYCRANNDGGGELWWSAQTRAIHGVADDFRPELTSAVDFYLLEHRPIISSAVTCVRPMLAEEALPWLAQEHQRAMGRPRVGGSLRAR